MPLFLSFPGCFPRDVFTYPHCHTSAPRTGPYCRIAECSPSRSLLPRWCHFISPPWPLNTRPYCRGMCGRFRGNTLSPLPVPASRNLACCSCDLETPEACRLIAGERGHPPGSTPYRPRISTAVLWGHLPSGHTEKEAAPLPISGQSTSCSARRK